MPNWVYNKVTITGSPLDIQMFKDRASAVTTLLTSDGKTHEVGDEFSFWNFIAPPMNKLDEYFETSGWSNGVKTGDSEWNWYHWNVANWGCKWDASEPRLDEETSDLHKLVYYFDTPWSPAEPAFKAMVERFPTLDFNIHCQEECGWGVVYTGRQGKLKVKEKWNEPDTHAACLKYDVSCVCVWADDEPERWYADCPGRATAIYSKITTTKGETNG